MVVIHLFQRYFAFGRIRSASTRNLFFKALVAFNVLICKREESLVHVRVTTQFGPHVDLRTKGKATTVQ